MWKYSFSAFSLPLLQLHLSLSGRRLLIRMNMGEGTMHIQRVSPKTTPTPISNYSPLPFNLIPHYLNVILCGAGASLFIPYRCYLTTLLVSRPTHRKEPLLVRPNEEEKKHQLALSTLAPVMPPRSSSPMVWWPSPAVCAGITVTCQPGPNKHILI